MDTTTWLLWMVLMGDGVSSTVLVMHGWDLERIARLFTSYEQTDISDVWVAGLFRTVAIPVALLIRGYFMPVIVKPGEDDAEEEDEQEETERDRLLGRSVKRKKEKKQHPISPIPQYVVWALYALYTIISTGLLVKIAFLTCFLVSYACCRRLHM